jgi:hypothetical protein
MRSTSAVKPISPSTIAMVGSLVTNPGFTTSERSR